MVLGNPIPESTNLILELGPYMLEILLLFLIH